MPLSQEQLSYLPLLKGITADQLGRLVTTFEQLSLARDAVLFREGEVAQAFYLLTEGEIAIHEGKELRYRLHPVAPIGELGALAGLHRSSTAIASVPSTVWMVTRDALLRFFHEHRDVALPFYQNLVELIADKVRRDQTRLDDMRQNIIRTQKAMKQMRDFLLESPETTVSEKVHDTLDGLIQHNRRVNYRIEPPDSLPARVQLDGGRTAPVVQISRTHLRYALAAGGLPKTGSPWTAVLWLSGPELAVSGKVLRTVGRNVDVELDMLIDEYGTLLDGYLARVQMLDYMV